MSLASWLSWIFARSQAQRAKRRHPATTSPQRRHSFRPTLEALETRLTPSLATLASFYPSSSAEYSFAAPIMDSSGNLYGTTQEGGGGGDGTVFELAKGTGLLTTLASFGGANGAVPDAGLIMDSSGNLYGTTEAGGTPAYDARGGMNYCGTVFELAHGSGTITTLASFNGTDGSEPSASLIMDSSGNLYGTTAAGGPTWDPTAGLNGAGTVFELAHGSGTITTLASFNGTNNPYAALSMDSSGNLYGTTALGGASSDGTVFELAHGSSTITMLASFNGTDGANSHAALIVDSSGNLYGTTALGSASSDGTVFELSKGSGTITTLASFNGTNGANPYAALIVDSSGNLYGTTVEGGASSDGTVFELAKGSGTLATLASFNGTDGSNPYAALSMDSSGNLYGTTAYGGTSNGGTVFELAQGSGTITTLGSFIEYNGTIPWAGLIMDSSGNLYGTTVDGGTSIDGTVFELAHGSGAITTLASFNGTNGSHPYAGLVMDSSGNLYGTTEFGVGSDGTVFEIAQGSGTISTLASFNDTDGAYPLGALIMDGSGNLYGTTSAGGASSDGTVFELAQGSGTITTLASFNGTDGANPHAALIVDSSGNLYGTAYAGGASSDGTVFELSRGSGTITALASFNGTNGSRPLCALILDSSGNLYGTAYAGGASSDGTVFELAQGSGTITTLASFNGTNGESPYAGLITDSSGNMYGTSYAGGASSDGTVFELAHGSSTLTTLASFNGTVGANPHAALIVDSSGNLYGTTYAGGAKGTGTVFELPGTSFHISGFPTSTGAGTAQTFTVTVQNINGITETGYTGTVHFTSSDPQAVLPANFTFTAANAGVATFTATLKTAGTQSITATDTANSFLTGSGTITVTAAAASSLTIGGFPSPTTAGTAANVTVTTLDAYGNIATGYTGTVHFTSSDAKAVLPANYTFTAADAGKHVFSVTLKTAGTQSLTATDTKTAGMTSTQTGITVNPAAASVLVITGPSTATSGVAFSITVTAYDAYGNVATGYTGTIHFTSSDSTATLPANYTFVASNAGTHTFTTLVLKKKGTQSIMVTDKLTSSISGSLSVNDS